ncbi:MAG: DHA2 family efflux MFS transporter permease subunit [Acidimicrobiales bacterium]|nr:MAG: DHA2 family efflux MFS transporter permease subunit [Acidimicrobiales bacterium]
MLARFEYKQLVAAVYMVSLFMQIIDSTIVNVAIPTLAKEFDVTKTSASWTVLSFVVALSAAIPAAGWLGDRFGLKTVFVWSMIGFTVASLLCGLSQNLEQLVISRALQGLFSGFITPVGAALLFKAFPLAERADASRKIITVVVIAPALGPVLGGVIIDALDWRWIFFVNIPIGLLAIWLSMTALIEDRHPDPSRLDIAGLVLSAVGLGTLVFGISQGSDFGWSSTAVVVSLVTAAVSLVLLIIVELRSAHPLLDLRLYRDRIFRSISIASLPIYAGFVSLLFLLPLFLDTAGYSPTQIGLALLPQPIGVMLASQLAGRYLYHRFGPRTLMFAGSIAAAIVSMVIASLELSSSIWTVRTLMFGRGLAMGVIFISVQAAVYAQTSPPDTGRATALFSTTRQFAPALGVAIVATVLASSIATPTGESTDLAVLESGYQTAMVWSALMFVVAVVGTLLVHNRDAAETMRST